MTFNQSREFEESGGKYHPFYYPNNLFSKGVIREFLIFSFLDEETTDRLKTRLENILPGQMTRNGFLKAKGTVVFFKDDLMVPSNSDLEDTLYFSRSSGTLKKLKTLMALKQKKNPGLVVIFQKDIEAPADLFVNIAAFAVFRTNYKSKVDSFGRTVFLENTVQTIFRKFFRKLKSFVKNGMKKMIHWS